MLSYGRVRILGIAKNAPLTWMKSSIHFGSMPPDPRPSGVKRPPSEHDRSISPPQLKRKAPSSISKSAVANFFTPTSQKPKDRTAWAERSSDGTTPATLLVGTYIPESGDDEPRSKRRKIAAFDLDSTLITSKSGKKHADNATDWKWWDSSVPLRLRDLYHVDGYVLIEKRE